MKWPSEMLFRKDYHADRIREPPRFEIFHWMLYFIFSRLWKNAKNRL